MHAPYELSAARYETFLSNFGLELAEEGRCRELPDEMELQELWHEGAFGSEFTDVGGRRISVASPGRWNRGAGPDFLDASVEIDGILMTGDIELDKRPEDWERHGHGANPGFNRVVLHVVCSESSRTWFTRNERHEEVARVVLDVGKPLEGSSKRCCAFFREMEEGRREAFLRSVAAYRLNNKRKAWKKRLEASGRDQALYECLAETLGYSANRDCMRRLAKRAPFRRIREHPEACLFGTAGFLVPVLKESCDSMTRDYHKELWECWWKNREDLELSEGRSLSWSGAGVRPSNHPQRRLAALALLVKRWDEWSGKCSLAEGGDLIDLLTSLEHSYWSWHVSLPSARMEKRLALVGKDRALDFLVNHVAAMDESSGAWEHYLSLPGGSPSSKVLRVAGLLLDGDDVKRYTGKAYQQQAFLQISADFCGEHCGDGCRLPEQSVDWI